MVNPDAVPSEVLPKETAVTMTRWERVAESIREQIRAKEGPDLRADEDGTLWLLSYRELGAPERHNVAYGTVRTALHQLRMEGWVEGEQGVGVRVRADHPK